MTHAGYTFIKTQAAGFDIFKSVTELGDEHRKLFAEDATTPASQATLNVYAEGEFSFSLEGTGISRTFVAGETSLDFDAVFPKGVLCVEKPLVAGATRYCVSSTKAKDTLYRKTEMVLEGKPLTVEPSVLVIVVKGEVAVGGKTFSGVSFFSTTQEQVLTSPSSAKVILLKCRFSAADAAEPIDK